MSTGPAAPGPAVLVVGAGPVGLTAAHELARRGLRVRLVDAASGPSRTSRAVAVHPRTLETFDQMGTVDGILRHGRRNRAFTMYAGGRRLVRLDADYTSMPTRHPYSVIIEQTRTEAVLREAVARLGVEVEWGVRLAGFEQDGTGVRARLTRADGTGETGQTEQTEQRGERGETGETEEICTVPWLVGCDGGHSTVRKALGLPLLGESRDTWMLADAPVSTDLPPDSIYWVHTGGQALMMVPYAREGHWRLLDTAPDRPDATGAAERFTAKLSRGLGSAVRVGDPEWTSVFTFQQRMVPRMHEGRVFVAGDAAHVHSPASGQGMNTGVQEAYNLAWKLAMVHRGYAERPLLDTYGEERVPVGKALLGSTRTATSLVQFKNALAAVALPVVFSVVRNLPPLRRAIQRKVLGGMSGLRLGYARSSLTTGGGPEPVPIVTPVASPVMVPRRGHVPAPGERVSGAATVSDALVRELRDVRWTLLVAPGGHDADGVPVRAARDAAGQHGAWLSVRSVGGSGAGPRPLPDPDGALCAALGLAAGSWALVRPDGYLAARGDFLTAGALAEALAPVRPRAGDRAAPIKRRSGGFRAVQDTVETETITGAMEMESTP
ncbi:oxygenase [Streptomyces sp. CB01635]|uniref:FAD-dependent oxidoreductase n=1 Tax=unclassified Streptomyces TaxID=2593676 RepID=UPI000C26E650|nr:FAD-dependent oxidoreductase [Streptomyces sp. CB01635]PJN06306.1 oxygenase [Streptomyces sp. CB01635]